MIEVRGLTKNYGKNRGIKNITFSIPEGQIVGFLGPNGAGKTTTLNIITGYLSAGSGDVQIAGIDMQKSPLEAKKHIGYLPEQPPLYNAMTVTDYLNFVYDLKKMKAKSRKDYIDNICTMTSLTDVTKRVIGHLSKGYKQRIGLAQALIGDPEVLVLDEPTIGLDPRQIVEMRNVIKKMGKDRTIILSTHILPEVSAICNRVLLISGGELIADDVPENLASTTAGYYSKQLVRITGSKTGMRQLLSKIDGVRNVTTLGEMEKDSCDFLVQCGKDKDVRRTLVDEVVRAGRSILMLRAHDTSLEDVFLKLTEESQTEEK